MATVLVLVAGAAQALGLGQIQVKSQPGEPLLAEIPIISSDPSELQALQVRLASPETFRRVGLQPPDMAATGLRFAVAVDARSRPVVRVTSSAPLSQPLLTFLLEVDWGEGRLVREYTALLASPSTVAATPAQPLQAPVVGQPNTIGQVTEPEVVTEPLQQEAGASADEAVAADVEPVEPVPAPAPVPEPAPEPTPEPDAIVAVPAPAPPPVARDAPPPVAPPVPAPESDYRVLAGDTLSEIASAIGHGDHSLDQTMLALLEANPAAFIGGNVNRLRAGAVLRMPQGGELARYSAGEAAALVRRQVAQWREATAALQSASATGSVAADSTAATTAADADAVGQAPADARLQIVPPSSETGKAGTRTGIQAGGEGAMLQQVQEAQETVAARDAEVGELKARVAELEKLQQQQQQLIAMKDSALAAAEKRLAESGTAAAQAAPAEAPADGSVWPWLLLPLVLVAAAAWWWLRRRNASSRPRLFTGAPRPVPPSSRPAPVRIEPVPPPVSVPPPTTVTTPGPAPMPSFVAAPVAEAPDEPAIEQALPATATAPIPEPVPPLVPESEAAPVLAEVGIVEPVSPHWTSAPALVGAPPVSPVTAAAALAAGREQATTPARQVELARAYLDLGDDGAARELLREVLDGRDPVARDIAARMLREL